jgi:hypothetical protein
MREAMTIVGKKPPCKDCTEREVGCHSKCQRFIEWKKREDLLKEEKREVGRALSDIIDYKRRVVVKHKRKRGEYNK